MRKALAAGAAFLAASAITMGAAGAAPADKVTICHGTASDTNPYVEVTVSANSFKDGHFDGGPPTASHGDNNHPDFVLEEGRSCSDGPGGGGSGTPGA
jgi:hypothetical protein